MESKSLPIILDIEASGFGIGSYPIEVGFVLPTKKRFGYLIKPENGWTHWSQSAQQQHHIERELLFDVGINASLVAAKLNHALSGEIVYTDAWGQDLSWLGKLYDVADCLPSFKLAPICNILSEAQMEIWHDTKDYLFNKFNEQRHRANADAAIIQACYEYTLKQTSRYHQFNLIN